jgi:methylphosphotriester-DNA--protein-cysteine methyltransferase
VHDRIELASRLLAAGNSDQAWATLRRVQEEMERIRPDAAEKDRRLKQAELLLEQTGHRLQQILAAASFEDRPVVEATLARVDQLQSQTMMQVFEK